MKAGREEGLVASRSSVFVLRIGGVEYNTVYYEFTLWLDRYPGTSKH